MASNGSEMLGPRACQIEQRVHRWSQPVWTATKLFTLASMPLGAMTSFAVKPLSLAAFPTTRDTPGIAAEAAGLSSAAQPVTRILEPGLVRCARRIACRV